MSKFNVRVYGILLSNTMGYDLQENNINDIGAGIKFSGICTSTRLLCNNLIECYHGVFADPAGLNTQISDQGDWTGTTSTSSSRCWKRTRAASKLKNRVAVEFEFRAGSIHLVVRAHRLK